MQWVPGQSGSDEHDDQTIRPFGDTDVAGETGALGAGFDVGRELAENQAQQTRGEHPTLEMTRVEPGDPGEHRGVGDPVAR